MRQSEHSDLQPRSAPDRPARQPSVPAASGRSAAPSPAAALALQRAVGNRAAARVIARWSKHPDEKEKGKLLSDDAALDYMHFNVPLNK